MPSKTTIRSYLVLFACLVMLTAEVSSICVINPLTFSKSGWKDNWDCLKEHVKEYFGLIGDIAGEIQKLAKAVEEGLKHIPTDVAQNLLSEATNVMMKMQKEEEAGEENPETEAKAAAVIQKLKDVNMAETNADCRFVMSGSKFYVSCSNDASSSTYGYSKALTSFCVLLIAKLLS